MLDLVAAVLHRFAGLDCVSELLITEGQLSFSVNSGTLLFYVS